MAHQVEVPVGKRVELPVSVGFNVSGMQFVSRIFTTTNANAPLITSWDVFFDSDGRDGELVLVLPASRTAPIKQTTGYMDLMRMVGGSPLYIFRNLEVAFLPYS